MKVMYKSRPKPHMLDGEQHVKWSVQGAVSELVDNGFGYLRGNAKNVLVAYDKRNHALTVFDDGSGFRDLSRLLQLGNTVGKSPADIGRFGAGGTKAILWLGKDVEIFSLHNGTISHVKVVWSALKKLQEFEDIEGSEEPATIANTPPLLLQAAHGTLIFIKLRDEKKIHVETVQSELAKTYAPALRQGRTLRWLTTKGAGINPLSAIPLSDPITSKFKKSVKVRISLDHNGTKLTAEGEVGIVPDHPISECKVFFGFGPRVIFASKDCFRSDTKSYAGRDIVGYVQLGKDWPSFMTTTKDDIDDEPLKKKLMDAIYIRIRSILDETEEDGLSMTLVGINLSLSLSMQKARHVIAEMVDATEELGTTGEMVYPDGPSRPHEEGEKAQQKPIGPDKPSHPQKDDGSPDKLPMNCAIKVELVCDAAINGGLCFAEEPDEAGQVTVYVNQDHWLMKEALQTKYRMFFYSHISREIAAMLMSKQGLSEKVFGRKIARKMETLSDRDSHTFIHRLIVDSVPRLPAPITTP